jgi:hypothetical protein
VTSVRQIDNLKVYSKSEPFSQALAKGEIRRTMRSFVAAVQLIARGMMWDRLPTDDKKFPSELLIWSAHSRRFSNDKRREVQRAM